MKPYLNCTTITLKITGYGTNKTKDQIVYDLCELLNKNGFNFEEVQE